MERKTQLFFYDNNKFEFIRRELKYSCLLEKKGGKMKRAWRHSYSGQYNFPGYKNTSADTVTLGFARDIFLDPHNKIPETTGTSGKPKRAGTEIKDWIARVAEDQRHIYRSKWQRNTISDYINISLIGVIFLMAIAWAISFVASRFLG